MNENLSIFPAILSGRPVTFTFLEEDEQVKVLTIEGHIPYADFTQEKINALEEACRQNGQVVTPNIE